MEGDRSPIWNISPVCLAAGILEGWRCCKEQTLSPDWTIALVWAVGAVAAMLLSGLLYRLLETSSARSEKHLLRTMAVFGDALTIASVLFVFALGVNLSGFFKGATRWASIAAGAAVTALAVLWRKPLTERGAAVMERFLDSDIILALSVLSVSALALFVSPAPSSACMLLLCGIFGCRVSKGWEREGLNFGTTAFNAMVLCPVLGFFAAYSIPFLADPAIAIDEGTLALILAVLCGLLAVLLVYISAQHRRIRSKASRRIGEQEDEINFQHRRVGEMEMEMMRLENEHLQSLLEMKRNETIGAAGKLSEQKEFIDSIYSKVLEAEACQDEGKRSELLHQIKAQISLRRNFSGEQDLVYAQAEQLHRDFSARLATAFPELTAQERKLATLLRLDFSTKYIASLLNISPKSVEIERHRLRTKLGLERKQKLTEFLKHI